MIAPDMATMLCFIFTDAAIAAAGAAGAAGRARADDLQLHDHRRRYLDQRHAACCLRPARRQSAASSRVTDATIRASPLSPPRCTT